MTGQYAAFGEQMKNGAEMAVADINAAGGVLGKKLELSIGDDACDPKQAVAVANQMPSTGRQVRGRALLLGLVDPGLEGLRRGAHRADLAGLDQSDPDRRARRSAISSASAAATTSRAASPATISRRHLGDKKIAFVHDKTAYGKGLADEFKKAMNAAGKKEVMYEAITAGDKDYHGARHQAQAGRRRRRLFRRLSHRGRADHPPDARAGPDRHPDGRRRAGRPRSSGRSPATPAKAR